MIRLLRPLCSQGCGLREVHSISLEQPLAAKQPQFGLFAVGNGGFVVSGCCTRRPQGPSTAIGQAG